MKLKTILNEALGNIDNIIKKIDKLAKRNRFKRMTDLEVQKIYKKYPDKVITGWKALSRKGKYGPIVGNDHIALTDKDWMIVVTGKITSGDPVNSWLYNSTWEYNFGEVDAD